MANPQSSALHYPIRAVSRMTGLSVDTLRAWERRYNAVAPRRSGRRRLYSDADVARLRQLCELARRGHSIGTIAGRADAELGRLLTSTDPAAEPPAPTAEEASLEPLTRALDRYDRETVEATLNRHAVVLPPRELVFAVILPWLREIGRRWEAGTLRPSQEHLVSASVRSLAGGLLRATSPPDGSPRIVFATPAGEQHELGLLCAALLAASAGYHAVYLGPDLPAEDIAHAAATTGARAVVVGLTTSDVVTPKEARTLARLSSGTELWAGGREAQVLLRADGRVRHIAGLDELVPMLKRHMG